MKVVSCIVKEIIFYTPPPDSLEVGANGFYLHRSAVDSAVERFEKKKNAERRVMITLQHTFADELQQLGNTVSRGVAPARGAAMTVVLEAYKKVRGGAL